jgi:hypothetical protein
MQPCPDGNPFYAKKFRRLLITQILEVDAFNDLSIYRRELLNRGGQLVLGNYSKPCLGELW